jgi:hypothetical protein
LVREINVDGGLFLKIDIDLTGRGGGVAFEGDSPAAFCSLAQPERCSVRDVLICTAWNAFSVVA